MTPVALFQHAGAWPLLLLAPLVWLAFGLLERGRRRRIRRLVGSRVSALVEERSRGRRALRGVIFALALLLALVALLGPLVGEPKGDVEWAGVDVVVGLDVSRSMRARDLEPDRLGRAKAEIRALARRAEGDRLALVVFAGDARLAVPLTRDLASFAVLVEQADPADVRRGGTDLGAALEASGRALDASEAGGGAVLLLTDGEDHEGKGLGVARRLGARGITVHAVGLGSSRGSKIALPGPSGEVFLEDGAGTDVVTAMDAAGLERMAAATGGTFVDAASSKHPLVDLYEEAILPMARRSFASEENQHRENGYQMPLLLALILWLLALALPDRIESPAPSHALPTPARRAAATASLAVVLLLLGGCDQTAEGRRAYEEGRYDEARTLLGAAVEEAGDDASSALLYDHALAACRTGAWAEAEAAAREAEAKGGDRHAGLEAFVRGAKAFAWSRELEVDAQKPGADARALLPPLKFAEDALAAWQWAAASRAGWPEARRNVERALLWLHELRERRSEGKSDGPPPPPPPPSEEPDSEEAKPDPLPELETKDLPPARVLGLLELLGEKEREKLLLRRVRRQARSSDVEKDW